MFEDLKKNINEMKGIIGQIKEIHSLIAGDPENKTDYEESISLLLRQLSLLNKATPVLLGEWGALKKRDVKKDTIRVNVFDKENKSKKYVRLNKADRKKYLEMLKLTESSIKNIKKTKKEGVEIRKPSFYAQISNKFFREASKNLVHNFPNLSSNLKRANIRFLPTTFISMALMSILISFFFGLLIFGILMAFNINNFVYIWIPFACSMVTALMFYFYPISEANSIQKKISYELPFATIYMGAIASSNIEPMKIFRIIALSKEYPNIGREIRKIVAQVDIYGYDLVTALKTVASKSSNKKLAELFSGIATNISSGGSLRNYLEKKAENFLLDYRLERQRYTKMAETFMDIYISILIAAPLVLMMLFIVMNISGLSVGGLGIKTLMILSNLIIIVTNIIFLVVINFKQPKV